MKMNNIRLFLPVFLLVVFIMPIAGQAQAPTVGIKISPIKIKEMVDPGEVLEKIISITNESDSDKILYPVLRDFRAKDETGTPDFILPSSEPGPYLSSWVDIPPDGVNLGPNETKDIKFKVNVPPTIGPGGYYGAVVFGTEPPKIKLDSEEKGAAMTISQQVAALLLLQVRGEVREEANIREFGTEKSFYGTPFSVKFFTRINNSGNVFIEPHGTIKITNMLGKEITGLPFNDRGSNILQQSTRRFENFWTGDQGFGRYRAELILAFGTNASSGGQGKQTITSAITFWIIPWKVIIPGFVAALIIGALIFMFLNFYKNKAVQRAMEQIGVGQARYIRKYQGPSPALHAAVIVSSLLFTVFMIGVVVFFILFA